MSKKVYWCIDKPASEEQLRQLGSDIEIVKSNIFIHVKDVIDQVDAIAMSSNLNSYNTALTLIRESGKDVPLIVPKMESYTDINGHDVTRFVCWERIVSITIETERFEGV